MIESKIIENDVVVAVDLIDLDAATVTRQVDGKTVSVRDVTDDDRTLFGSPPPDDRLAALEAQHTALLDALATATSLAAVRKAAADTAATSDRRR